MGLKRQIARKRFFKSIDIITMAQKSTQVCILDGNWDSSRFVEVFFFF